MLVQELRIGNFLKWPKPPTAIKKLSGSDIFDIEQGNLYLEPILLNHFWFKNFEFKRHVKPVTSKDGNVEAHVFYEKHFIYDDHAYKFQIWSDEDGTFFSFYENFKPIDKKNKYVHMLQNAYFDFTHQELKKI